MATYFNSHIQIALQLIAGYNGQQPLATYLKQHFAQHKKHGSQDRKNIAHFCYCYYRLGFALRSLPAKEQLLVAIFLCTSTEGKWLSMCPEEWQHAFDENLAVRIDFIQSIHPFKTDDLFFDNNSLSDSIEVHRFNESMLIQPSLFLRIRPNKNTVVFQKLEQEKIAFKQLTETCIALDNTTKADAILELNSEAVVQDLSSQSIASFFRMMAFAQPPSVWDCCAASGGKSILVFDTLPNVQLTVSDIRQSILQNLQKRFAQVGIRRYRSFVADLAAPHFTAPQQHDLVICDAPCSGSGTWSRTPEQLLFFTDEKRLHYTSLQKKITANAATAVKKNGYFLYVTCSVYRQENEDIVLHISETSGLNLIKQEVIKGYDVKADTMFAALFIKK